MSLSRLVYNVHNPATWSSTSSLARRASSARASSKTSSSSFLVCLPPTWFGIALTAQTASDVIVSLYNPAGATDVIKTSGVEVRHGDFTKPATLEAAFAGADKLLIVSYPTIAYDMHVHPHRTAIDAAIRVGIKHIYYTSLTLADDSQAVVMQAHLATEAYLKQCGVTYTVIREGIYSESWRLYVGSWDPKRENRELRIPRGDGGIAWVSRDDLGEGTAKLMIGVGIQNLPGECG